MPKSPEGVQAETMVAKAGRLLKNSEWKPDGQADYLMSAAQILAILDLAAAIRGDEGAEDEDVVEPDVLP